jgi:hypothetical protein
MTAGHAATAATSAATSAKKAANAAAEKVAVKTAQILRLLASEHPRGIDLRRLREAVGAAKFIQAITDSRRRSLIVDDGRHRVAITRTGIAEIERLDGCTLVRRPQ